MAQYVRNSLDDFGARYLDPMLGMWTGVDPARQFASPYLYAGNGTNSIGYYDGAGDYLIRKFGGRWEIHIVTKADAWTGWFVKEFVPSFIPLSFVYSLIKSYIDDQISANSVGKDAIVEGASRITSLENKVIGKGVGSALGVFDAIRVAQDVTYDSPEFIAEFNNRMLHFKSFATEEEAKAAAQSVEDAITPTPDPDPYPYIAPSPVFIDPTPEKGPPTVSVEGAVCNAGCDHIGTME